MNILKINLNEQLKNNYVYLPKDYVETHLNFSNKSFEEQVNVIKLKKINSEEFLFLGWMGGISSKEGVIEISSALGRSLNLRSGEFMKAFSSHSEDNSVIESIELIPVSNYDYKVIESNASFFEENMLNQIMVVFDGLIFPFLFFDNKVANLKVNLEKKNKGFILSQDCEVKVAFVPPVAQEEEKQKFNQFTLKDQIVSFNCNEDYKVNLEKAFSLKVNRNFLLENFNTLFQDNNEGKTFTFNINFADCSKDLIFRLSDKSTITNFYNTAQKYKKSTTKEELTILLENNFINKFPYKNNFWINLIVDDFSSSNNILLEEFLKLNTILFNNDKIDLTLFKFDFVNNFNDRLYVDFICNNLKIEYYFHSLNSNSVALLEIENYIKNQFLNFIEKNDNLFLNLDFIYIFNFDILKNENKLIDEDGLNTGDIMIRINFNNNKSLKDYSDILSKLKINLNSNKIKNNSNNQPFVYLNKNHSKIIEHLNLVFSNELNIIFNYNLNNKNNRHIFQSKNFNLCSEENSFITKFNNKIVQNDLIRNSLNKKLKDFFSNKQGTFLTVISFPKDYDTKLMMARLYQSTLTNKIINVYINMNLFNFNDYTDLKIFEEYLKQMTKFYLKSNTTKLIFIIEGLERFKKLDSGQIAMASPLTAEINNSVSYILTKFINKCNKVNNKSSTGNLFYIYILISGSNVENLPIDFLTKNNSFDIVKISYTEKSIVKEILLEIMKKIPIISEESSYVEECVELCNNFVLTDFLKILKLISNNRNNSDDQLKVEFTKVLSNYIPIGIVDEKILKLGNDFSNIGGMNKIKEEIYDTIVLSIKSSELFKNKLPIKMPSGILLTGPPGCGKTLIASALQKEFKINFYSVKGPELLNKYIGASEAAIREVFENAKKTVPCIVFFDEFDSLAPKRGSGSSGVTDRIVNQLLTYLDGIESREGIFVVGATSRPDLIDPAILRPGRLDKIILCDFPDSKEREDILNLYYCKASPEQAEQSSKEEKTLKYIAENTSYFTGADLQSLIYNAFLISVKRNIQNNLDSHAIITEEDLRLSFKNLKPSISDKEIKFHTEIKSKFSYRLRSGDSVEFENNSEKMKKLNENDLKMTLY